MKVLLISNFSDGTGYSTAAINKALALDVAGIDVVLRNIRLGDNVTKLPARINELLDKDDTNPDVVIQYTLPHLMSYNAKVGYNIATFDYETTNFIHSSWADKLNTMDEVWVHDHSQKSALINSGVKTKARIIPHSCDVDKYKQNYLPLSINGTQNSFIFYTVGEFVRRKNFGDLIKAFHTSFDKDENVQLLIKSSVPGQNSVNAKKIITEFCNEIKRGLKIYNDIKSYKQEIIITDRLSQNDIMRLHKTGNCFISTSHGEGFCYPAMDALGIGNFVIGCSIDYLNDMNGYNILSYKDMAFGAVDSFNDLYTSDEGWNKIDMANLQDTMQHIYQKENNEKYEAAINTPYQYSYENVGLLMKEALNAIKN